MATLSISISFLHFCLLLKLRSQSHKYCKWCKFRNVRQKNWHCLHSSSFLFGLYHSRIRFYTLKIWYWAHGQICNNEDKARVFCTMSFLFMHTLLPRQLCSFIWWSNHKSSKWFIFFTLNERNKIIKLLLNIICTAPSSHSWRHHRAKTVEFFGHSMKNNTVENHL